MVQFMANACNSVPSAFRRPHLDSSEDLIFAGLAIRWETTMNARATIVCCLLMLGVTLEARSADVTTYGTGLIPCSAYLAARQQERLRRGGAVPDWLVGYFSGANATSNRHNNILGPSDIHAAMGRLDELCRHKPSAQFAEAAGALMFGAASAAGAHSSRLSGTALDSSPVSLTSKHGGRKASMVENSYSGLAVTCRASMRSRFAPMTCSAPRNSTRRSIGLMPTAARTR